MDYTQTGLGFRIKKTLRYTRLYGPRHTLAKIRGQYHMKRCWKKLPENHPAGRPDGHIGIIGCGNFAYSYIAYFLKKYFGPVIRATMDTDLNRAASLFQDYGAAYYTKDPEEIFQDSRVDLVFIASNHASHAEYAIKALQAGKCVHIEKPHVVNQDQLDRLCRAIGDSRGKVRLGFNRPESRIGRTIKGFLEGQSGPAMFNWFIAGHEIAPDHWYFRKEEGGRVLGNLCHWTDFLLRMVAPGDRYPLTINPTRAEKSDCDIAVTFTFGDGTIGAITFSAKGHTFEGVRERFAAHRGDVLISMDDFKTLGVEVAEKKHNISNRLRDHGHRENIRRSYEMVRPRGGGGGGEGCPAGYVRETGELFLKTRDALQENRKKIIAGGGMADGQAEQ